MHHVFEGYEPWAGSITTRSTGSMVADRTGAVTSYALFNLQERGVLFIKPADEVYEGMIVGENPQRGHGRQPRPRRRSSPMCVPRRARNWSG